jgi:hypothetical protein
MKTMFTLKKVWISPALLVILFLLVLVSCKKKEDDNPTPTPTPTPLPDPMNQKVFIQTTFNLLSKYDQINNRKLNSGLTRGFAKGIRGEEEPEFPDFDKLGDIAWETYDFRHTEMRFDQIDNSLNQIQNQIATLSTDIQSLAAEIGITAAQTQALTIYTTMMTNINEVQGAMTVVNAGGLQYYANQMSRYQSGDSSVRYQDMVTNQGSLATLMSNIWENSGGINVVEWESNLFGCIDLNGANGLGPLTDLVITNTVASNNFTSDNLMNAYQIIESFFLEIVNAQFQCSILMRNARNYEHPEDSTETLDFDSIYLYPHLKKEIVLFQQVVDYFYVNLNEYRSGDRFNNDMGYFFSGIAPEETFVNILGRSQFVINSILDGIGANYPVNSGVVLTPWNYTNGNSPIVTTLQMKFTPTSGTGQSDQPSFTALQYNSRIPYTYWDAGDPATCSSDNRWLIYHIKHDTAGANITAPAYDVNVVDNGNGEYPWHHYTLPSGSITPLWYDPSDPKTTSPTRTSTCTFQFGFFSVAWTWGFLMTHQTGHWHFPDISPFKQTTAVQDASSCSNPNTWTTNSHGVDYEHGGQFNYPYGNFAQVNQGGNTIETGNYYCSIVLGYINIKTSDVVPPNNGACEAWSWYKIGYNMRGSGGDDIWAVVGVSLTEYTDNVNHYTSYSSNSEIVNWAHYHDQMGNWNTGSGTTSLSTNKSYQPNFEFFYQTYNVGTMPAFVGMYNAGNVVYGGTYPYVNL